METNEEEKVPYIPPNTYGIKQVYWERIWLMRLLDDTMMRLSLIHI